jgi:polar amino acid transport system substrate-binding protein
MLNILNTFVLFITLLLTGCVASQTSTVGSDIPGQQLLKVGITTNAPPMAYREGGKITGLETEFAKGIADYSKRNLRFIELKWEDQIPALLSGKIDIIMSAMTVTQARKYQIAFADPYMVTGQVSLVRLVDYNRFSDGFTALLSPTVRVGMVKATTGEFLVSRNKAKGAMIKYNNAQQGVQALLDKKIDAFVYDLPMNFYFGAKYTDQGLTPITVPMSREYIAWGIRKDDSELLTQANAYLQEIKSSGDLQHMIIRWIPFYEKLYNK